MDIEKVRKYCISKDNSTESFPFDNDSPVYKIANKIFCIINLKYPYSINLKCDPEKAIELREEFDDVLPGYHMNKKHWNTILLTNNIKEKMIKEWIDDSYNLIYNSLSKKEKLMILNQENKK